MKKFAEYAWYHAIDHLLIVAMVVFLATSLIEISFSVSFLNPMARALSNFSITDVFYDIGKTSDEKEKSDLVTLVDITDVYDRGELAGVVEELERIEPAVMGIDIVFDGLRDDSVGNERLIEAALDANVPTVWACKLGNWDDDAEQFSQTTRSFFADICDVDEGFTNVQRDVNGGTVRKFGVQRVSENKLMLSLPAKVAKIYTGEDPIKDAEMSCAINFHPVEFPIVPVDSIAECANQIRGCIVLLGATRDPRDMHYTPLGLISGLHVLAYTVKTLVEHQSLSDLPDWLMLAFSFLVVFFTQVAQSYAFDVTVRHRLGSVKCLGRMGVTSCTIFFAVVTAVVGLSFILYMRCNVDFDVKWAIMGTALLGTARLLYSVIINLLGDYGWPGALRELVNKSIYRYESERKTNEKIDIQQSTLEL